MLRVQIFSTVNIRTQQKLTINNETNKIFLS